MRLLLSCLLLLLAAAPGHADVRRGASLHQANCVACHNKLMDGDGATLYTRADRKVRSLPGLRAQVQRCQANLRLQWFDEEVEDVASYLNSAYYRFKP